MNYFNYKRRVSSEVCIGDTPLGGKYPIRIQSMTNTSTMDTEASVAQCIRIIHAGADYVRLTAQGVREAENLANVRNALTQQGYHTPLVADIHFNPKAADAAACVVEKVRINPGNFVDSARTFTRLEYTDEEYRDELQKIRDRFLPFLEICRQHRTAVRIGVNHGSLSDRIMSRYGDTPQGMVESCLEFLRLCKETGFHDVAISIKASNTIVMVKTVRLLVAAMEKENMFYPLHLGVTEAGDSEDGRIKSAVGIGTLLADGIGDTIRVSLSEDPEKEIPVARKLVQYISGRDGHAPIDGATAHGFEYSRMEKRQTRTVGNIGSAHVPVVISSTPDAPDEPLTADYLYIGTSDPTLYSDKQSVISDLSVYRPSPGCYPLFHISEIAQIATTEAPLKFLEMNYADLNQSVLLVLKNEQNLVVILYSDHQNPVGEQRAFFHRLIDAGCDVPVILKSSYRENDDEELQLKAGADFGALLLDGFGNGLFLENHQLTDLHHEVAYMYSVLQATRSRISKTEYISCPSCGRTLFDLQSAIARIKAATSHLTGLKIGIMGCIVNGPGEMADADYGYVGAGRGKISLYKSKICLEKNIPEELAVEKLVELIKQHGDWREP